jgi:hypothetical protein
MERYGEFENLTSADRRDLLSVNLTIWIIVVHCAPVATDVAMVSSP